MPGGRALIDRLRSHVTVIRDLINVDRRTIVLDPELIELRRDQALERIRTILAILDTDLPPMLERNERNHEMASLPDRVARLEAALEALEADLAQRSDLRVIRREG